jgi:uncharacterized protein YfaS (alpha-2-macroglobulin family)
MGRKQSGDIHGLNGYDRSRRCIMKTWPRIFPFVFFSASCFAGIGCSKTPPAAEQAQTTAAVHLIGFSHEGEGEAGGGSSWRLVARFDQPIVDANEVGAILEPPPVTIDPAGHWIGHFNDRQTLVLRPTEALSPATAYDVRWSATLAQKLGVHDVVHRFVHEPMTMTGIEGLRHGLLVPNGTFVVRFSQPAWQSEIEKKCRLLDVQGQTIATEISAHAGEKLAASFEVKAVGDMPMGEKVSWQCQDVLAEKGNAPSELLQKEIDVLAPLTMRALHFGESGRVAPDGVVFEFDFSTIVDGAALAKAVQVEPEIPGLIQRLSERGESSSHRVVIDVEPYTRYKVRVADSLRDVFEQELGVSPEATFQTTSAEPSLRAPTGLRVIERDLGGLAVRARALSRIDVECSSLPRDRVVAALTGDQSWSSYDAKQAKSGFRKLVSTAHRFSIEAKNEGQEWREARIDLLKECTNPGDVPLILARISSPEIKDPSQWRYPYTVLANLTNLGLVLKTSGSNGILWVVDFATGKPVQGAKASFFYRDVGEVASGTSDGQGLVQISGLAEFEKRRKKKSGENEENWANESGRLVVIVENEGDVAVVAGDWDDGISSWNFGVDHDWSRQAARARGIVLSDRGIYRPGETVNFRGIVREMQNDGPLRVPKIRNAEVSFRDPQGRIVYETTAPISKFGGFSTSYRLPYLAKIGEWTMHAKVGELNLNETVSVQEFRPQTFELVDASESAADAGSFRFRANYLTGQAVAQANGVWQVASRPAYLNFAEFAEFTFDPSEPSKSSWGYSWYWGDDESRSLQTSLGDGKVVSDAQGMAAFAVKVPSAATPIDLVGELSLTDASGQSVSKRVVKTHHPVDAYIGILAQDWVTTVGEPAHFDVVALDPKGKRVAAKGSVVVIEREWVCNNRYYGCETKLNEISRTPLEISKSKVHGIDLKFEKGGSYIVQVVAKDGQGRSTQSHVDIWSSGRYDYGYSTWEDRSFRLAANRRAYEAGDRAKFGLTTALDQKHVLMTAERSGILEAWVVTGEAAQRGVGFDIRAEHAPNIFVSATVVGGRRGRGEDEGPSLRMGVAGVRVQGKSDAMSVEIRTEKETYQPGDLVRGEVLTNLAGKGVGTEISLSVADEGVLALIGYKTPDPSQTFGAPWARAVSDSANWVRLLKLEDLDDDEEGGDGSTAKNSARVRTNFLSSAYWNPALRSDPSGKATFEFRAPDNLTAFRMMAVAADAGDHFGKGEKRIVVRKEVQALPIAPRFLTEGDQVALGTVLTNHSAKSSTISVDVHSQVAPVRSLATLVAPANQGVFEDFEVAAAGTRRKTQWFSVAAAKNGTIGPAQVELSVQAKMDEHRDAFAIAIPFINAVTRETRSLFEGPLSGNVEEPLNLPANVRKQLSTLEVRADTLGLSQVSEGLAYLVTYPYGCLEQTISKVLPMTGLHGLLDAFALPEISEDKLDGYIQAGIEKIARHQAADGHFSLWPDSEGDAHLTAYALYALREIERAGFAVPADTMSQGRNALKRWVDQNRSTVASGEQGADLAMAAYVLALRGEADVALIQSLFDNRQVLPQWGQVLTYRALHAAGLTAPEETMLAEFSAKLTPTRNGGLELQKPASYYHDWDSHSRTQALFISALVAQKKDSPLIERLVRGLLDQRTGSRWETTQDNLYALIAISDVVRTHANARGKVQVKVGDKVLANLTLEGMKPQTLIVPLSQVPEGPLSLRAEGKAVVSAIERLVRTLDQDPRLARGFEVSRAYLDPKSGKEISSVMPGDLVLIRLTVHAQEAHDYVAIHDPLPAGLEPLIAPSNAGYGYDDERWWTHADDRDQATDIFADHLGAGTHVYERFAQAGVAGRYVALPTTVEAMYDARPFGRSSLAHLEVKEAP